MLFQKKQDYILPVQSDYSFGGQVRFQITREYPIESIFLVCDATITHTTTANPLADGLLAMIRRVTLNGPDGSRNRNVVDASGAALVELCKQWGGELDRSTLAIVNSTGTPVAITTATNYQFVIPIFFCPPNIDDPLGSALLLPADRYNADLQLQVQLGAAGDLFGTVGDAALTRFRMTAIVNRRIVDRKNWPILDAELTELSQDFVANGNNQLTEIPITGYYTGILIRGYRSSVANLLTRRGDVSVTTLGDLSADIANDWDIRMAGNVMRRFRLADLQRENDMSAAHGSAQGDVLAGSYFLDFVQDRPGAASGDVTSVLNSLLNANIPLNAGTRIFLRQEINAYGATAPVRVKYLLHRIYGNLEGLKL